MADFNPTFTKEVRFKAGFGVQKTGGGGTSDYNDLRNKPSISGTPIEGDHDPDYYGIQSLPAIGQYDESKVITVYNGKWQKRKVPDIYYKFVSISDWGGNVTVDGLSFEEFQTIIGAKPVDFLIGGYSGMAHMAGYICLYPAGANLFTNELFFKSYENTADGYIEYLVVLGTTGSGANRQWKCDFKKFTHVADA